MTLHFEDFVLDMQRYELRRDGTRVPMEPQVFDVLALLAANSDRVVTKDELMDSVWGDRFISEAALNSRVMSARKAIGDTGRDQRLIRTVHGRGYRFVGAVAQDAPVAPTSSLREARNVVAHAVAGSPAAPTLLGRDEELTRLQAWFDEAVQGERRVVLISGEAGLGKTTLLQAFLAGLDPETVSVAHGQCLDHRGEGEPYMPVLEALTRLCHGEYGEATLEEIRQLAPSWLAQMPGLVDPDEIVALRAQEIGAGRERMLREIVECLDGIARIRPLVFVLEDLHWSDKSTLDVLSMVAHRRDPARLLTLATYRPADATASRHALPAMLGELTLRGFAHELKLDNLSPATVETYVNTRAGSALPVRVAEALAQRTSGHPLYMGMVYEAWRAEGLLDPDAGIEIEKLAGPLPDTASAYINQRFSLLTGDERAVLEAASVVGREFAAAAIAPALELPVEAVEAACEALARAGYFIAGNGDVEWPNGTLSEGYVFLHDLYAEVLYAGIPAARLRRLHQDVGAALEAGYADAADDNATELALHFARGRHPEKSVAYLRLAGEQALRRAAGQEAAQHLAAALEFVSRLPEGRERDEVELLTRIELASALIPSRGWSDQEVEKLYVTALDLAERLQDESLTSVVLFGMASLYEVRGEYARSGELMNRRLDLDSRPGSTATVESLELLACSEFHRGMFADSLAHAEQGIALYTPESLRRTAALGENPGIGCYDWAGLSLLLLGYSDQAVRRAEEALALASDPVNRFSLSLAYGQAAVLYQLLNLPAPALEHARAAIEVGFESGFLYHVAWSGIIEAWARVMLGDCDAIVNLKDCIERSLEIGARMDHLYYLGMLAQAHLACGDLEAARRVAEEALSSQRDNRRFFYHAELLRLKGVVLLQRDGLPAAGEARRLFEDAMQVAATHNAKPFQLRAAAELVKLARVSGEDASAAEEQLSSLLNSYEEGFDIPDLEDARALLQTPG